MNMHTVRVGPPIAITSLEYMTRDSEDMPARSRLGGCCVVRSSTLIRPLPSRVNSVADARCQALVMSPGSVYRSCGLASSEPDNEMRGGENLCVEFTGESLTLDMLYTMSKGQSLMCGPRHGGSDPPHHLL